MNASASPSLARPVRLFLCGDVMTGRGIDQILPNPNDPLLHESYTLSALDYVRLAEAANGPIPRQASPSYIWGAALDELHGMRLDARIINLETSVTRSADYLPKGINYRMSPENADCLKAAAIDCCVLANNHVLDYARRGLLDTLDTLARLAIKTAGAGRDDKEASAPAILNIADNRRLLVFSFASPTSGTPHDWAATAHTAGVNLLTDISENAGTRIARQIVYQAKPNDLIVVSIHWGSNWGYEIPRDQRRFAHALIDRAGVSVIHGHSSHHPKAMEVYRDRLIFYGCGDFLNDYEGIKGYERYRDDLVLMFFPEIDYAGNLSALDLVPLKIRNFRLVRQSREDILWMRQRLNRESQKFGVTAELSDHGRLSVSWKRSKLDGVT